MAKFMVKRSELKNVCKAVNDRKLAELKKEIIEILKKQDEKDFKKATDYLNSQEEHYTHLEKSLSGKWIEKAGYGIGTVRVWKGKKYKKIAPDKWVRVFEKEGRGTNIAIGKLIAKVQKIDNVEDLMAFVMANKQRFVDENGVDLPVLDKLRAAVGVKNENLSGESSSYTYGVGEDVSREKNKIFEGKEKITKEEADLHKVSRKFEQIPTTELKQRKAKLERWIENKTRNKRDSLNNTIFRESYQKELDAINAVLDKRNEKKETSKPAEKKTVQGVKILSKDEIHNLTKGEVQDYRKELHDAMKKLDYGADDFDILYATKKIADDTWNNKEYKGAVDSDKNIKEFAAFLKENNLHQHDKIEYKGKEYVIDYDSQGGDGDLLWIAPVFDDSEFDVSKIKIKEEKKPAEKEDYKIAQSGKLATQKQVDYATEISDKYSLTREEMLKKPITAIQKYANSTVEDFDGGIDKFIEYMADGRSEGVSLDEVGKEFGKLINHNIARKIWKDYESGALEVNNDGIFVPKKEPEMNNPESLKGIDFVNKNKMHVLANFLANHDGVNMATAVIRLQNAYERLGEEKFLSYFPKDIVDKYKKEAGKEETKTESSKFTPKKDFKSMSDDELKDYEAELEKDLLNSNRTDSDYMDKYNHWREVHGENNDRFHQRIADEAKAEKQHEEDVKAEKEKEIKEKYNGYFDNRKGLDRARDLKSLEKKYKYDGKVLSNKEFVEQAMDNGAEIKEHEVNKIDYPSRTRWNRMTGYEQDQWERKIKEAGKKTVYTINGYEFPKSVVDYAKYYKEKGRPKSGSENSSKSEIAIKNKASSLAGAFGYSKTYAMKMGSPFNLELAEQTVDEELDWDDGSKKALKEELRRIYSEKKVQKSLFDDFIIDNFIDEEINDEEEEIEERSLWNDYSAEEPDDFNSTELQVREAMNRHFGNCL